MQPWGFLAARKKSGTPIDVGFLYDGNGNVTQVVDLSDESVEAHYEYDPFGKEIVATGNLAEWNKFRFSTKYREDKILDVSVGGELGLYYYGYRYYSPRLGRWVNRDPIGEHSALLSLLKGKRRHDARSLAAESLLPQYLFVRNAPINNADKDGCSLIGTSIGISLVAILAGKTWKGLCTAHANVVLLASNRKLEWEMLSICPGYNEGDIHIEGTIADAMQHCVGACELMQNRGICCFKWVIKKGLKDYEKGKGDPAALMDLANNDVGIAINSDCLDGCKAKLNAGGLKCLDSAGNLSICNLPK